MSNMDKMVAACMGGDVATVRAILNKKGFDVNQIDPDSGGTLLMVAAMQGHAECLEVLLDAGAKMEEEHPVFGMTAFHWACYNAHHMCVELLVEAKCDATKKSRTAEVKARGEEGLGGQELAAENMRPGWEKVVAYLREVTDDTSVDISEQLNHSSAQNSRMRKTLGDAGDNDDAMKLLFTTEQTKQGGHRARHAQAGQDGGGVDVLKQKEDQLRAELSQERMNRLFQVVDDRLDQAREAESGMTEMLQNIARIFGGELQGLDYKIKTRDSTFNKILRKSAAVQGTEEEQDRVFQEGVLELRDLLRYTLVLSTANYVDGVRGSLKQFGLHGVEAVPGKLKNFWRRKGVEADYLGINGSFVTALGFPCELQFHTVESIDMKEGDAHVAYEKFRLTTGKEKFQWWEEMTRVWSTVPLPAGGVLEIGEKAFHSCSRESLAGACTPDELDEIDREDKLAGTVRPWCDQVYRRNFQLEVEVSKVLRDTAKLHKGKSVGEEHTIKSSYTMTKAVVQKLLKEGMEAGFIGVDDHVKAAVQMEAQNGLRYTWTFPEKDYTSGVQAVLKALEDLGFGHQAELEGLPLEGLNSLQARAGELIARQELLDTKVAAMRAKVMPREKLIALLLEKETHPNLINNYWLSKEPYNAIRGRMARPKGSETDWVGFVFHTTKSLAMSEDRILKLNDAMGIVIHTATMGGGEATKEAERLMQADTQWQSRSTRLSTTRPPRCDIIGKKIVEQAESPSGGNRNRRASMSFSGGGSMSRGSSGSSGSMSRGSPSTAGSHDRLQPKGRGRNRAATLDQRAINQAMRMREMGVVEEAEPPEPEPEPEPERRGGGVVKWAGFRPEPISEAVPKKVAKVAEMHPLTIEILTAESLQEHLPALLAGGLHRISVLTQADKKDLKALKIPPGHAGKIVKMLKKHPAVAAAVTEELESGTEEEPESKPEPESKLHLGGSMDSRVRAMERAWARIDSDDSGALDRSELAAMLLQMGMEATDENLDKAIQEMDTDNSGYVEQEEFFTWFMQQQESVQDEIFELYYEKDGQQVKTKLAELTKLMEAEMVGRETKIWVEGMEEWTTLAACLDGGSENVSGRVKSVLESADKHSQQKMLEKVWARVDADGSGSLDRNEVRDVLVQMSFVPKVTESSTDYAREVSKSKIDKAMRELDKDGSGVVDFDKFSVWFLAQDLSKQENMIVVHYQSLGGEPSQTTVAQLPDLIATGKLSQQTLVWVEGMDDWEEFGGTELLSSSEGHQASQVAGFKLKGADAESQRKMLEKVWARVDLDGSGTLDRNEVHFVLDKMGFERVSKRQLDKVMKQMDQDQTGGIDFEEFSQWFLQQDLSKQENMIVVHYQNSNGEPAQTTMAELPNLIASLEIADDTLVWIDGMDEWEQLGTVQKEGSGDLSWALADSVSNASVEVQHKMLQAVWARADADGNGTLDEEEVRTVLVAMGRESDDDALENAMIELDESGDGSVQFEEFCDWFWKETPAEQRERLLVVYYEDAAGEPATTTMAELELLLEAGTITQQTKVWIEGMEDWAALSDSSVQSMSPHSAGAVRKQEQQATAEQVAPLQRALLKRVWSAATCADKKQTAEHLQEEQILQVLAQIDELDPSDSFGFRKAMVVMETHATGEDGRRVKMSEFETWFKARERAAAAATDASFTDPGFKAGLHRLQTRSLGYCSDD